jgi:hypothetical protein
LSANHNQGTKQQFARVLDSKINNFTSSFVVDLVDVVFNNSRQDRP